MTRTLVLIIAFIALTLGSFIWFVATWNRDAEQPIGIILPKILIQQMPIAQRQFTGATPTQHLTQHQQPQTALS